MHPLTPCKRRVRKLLKIKVQICKRGCQERRVNGGSSSTGALSLDALAPTGGAVIALSSSDASVSVPATVPEGATSATFSVTTSAVATATTATVCAVFNGVTQTATITVEPPVLTSLALNPSGTTGGSVVALSLPQCRPA